MEFDPFHQLIKRMRNFQFDGKRAHDTNIFATIQACGSSALLTHNTKEFERFEEVIRNERV